jgi:hypothetical protein
VVQAKSLYGVNPFSKFLVFGIVIKRILCRRENQLNESEKNL